MGPPLEQRQHAERPGVAFYPTASFCLRVPGRFSLRESHLRPPKAPQNLLLFSPIIYRGHTVRCSGDGCEKKRLELVARGAVPCHEAKGDDSMAAITLAAKEPD